MREVGFTANRRLLHVEHISHDPATGAAAFTAVTAPADLNGQHAAGLRFGDPRAHALLLVFRLHPGGFTNADLRTHLAQFLGLNPATWTAGRAHRSGFDEQRRVGADAIIAGLRTHRPLRADLDGDTATDTMWLLMVPVAYRRPTVHRAWSPGAYQQWFVDSTRRLLFV
jgi:hypothetical protein